MNVNTTLVMGGNRPTWSVHFLLVLLLLGTSLELSAQEWQIFSRTGDDIETVGTFDTKKPTNQAATFAKNDECTFLTLNPDFTAGSISTSLACPGGDYQTLQIFDLTAMDSPGGDITAVSFGVFEAVDNPTVTVNIYELDGELLYSNMTLLASTNTVLSDGSDFIETVEFDEPATVCASAVLVVELETPGHYFGGFIPGYNDTDLDLGTTYIASDYCNVDEPTAVGSVLSNFTEELLLGIELCNEQEDTEDPVLDCSGLNITVEANCKADVELPIPGATDDCGVAALEFRYREVDANNQNIGPWTGWMDQSEAYVTFPIGRYRVRWRATDYGGNRDFCTRFVTVEGLPCGWTQQADGVNCEDGSQAEYDLSTEEFTVSSVDCYNPLTTDTDEYAFAQYYLCGDGQITALVTSLTGNAAGWAGVTMRASNDGDAQQVSLMTNLFNNHRTEVRLQSGGDITSSVSSSFYRQWLRLERIGNTFVGRVSNNGFTWFYKFSIQIDMPACIEMGLIVNSSNAGGDNTATFANVSVLGNGDLDLAVIPSPQQNAQFGDRSFSVFPNPTDGRATIQLSDFLEQEGQLEVLDINGRLVLPIRSGLLEYGTEEVDLSQLPAGLYVVRLRLTDGTVQTQRVVLQPRP